MSESTTITPFWAKVAIALASLMTVAFTSWAGVVWQGWQDVRELLFRVNTSVATVVVRLDNIEEKLDEGKDTVRQHQSRPWHDQAGMALGTIRLEIDSLRERLNKQESRD